VYMSPKKFPHATICHTRMEVTLLIRLSLKANWFDYSLTQHDKIASPDGRLAVFF